MPRSPMMGRTDRVKTRMICEPLPVEPDSHTLIVGSYYRAIRVRHAAADTPRLCSATRIEHAHMGYVAPGDSGSVEAMAAILPSGGKRAVILTHHGGVTLGTTRTEGNSQASAGIRGLSVLTACQIVFRNRGGNCWRTDSPFRANPPFLRRAGCARTRAWSHGGGRLRV